MVFTSSLLRLASTLGVGMLAGGGTFTSTFLRVSTSANLTLGLVSAGVFTIALLVGLVTVTGFLVVVFGVFLGVVFTIDCLLAMVSTFLTSGLFASFCFSFSLFTRNGSS